jgi:sulfate adenylyltransferase subunit 1 (EFTu-like GTPase family)
LRLDAREASISSSDPHSALEKLLNGATDDDNVNNASASMSWFNSDSFMVILETYQKFF